MEPELQCDKINDGEMLCETNDNERIYKYWNNGNEILFETIGHPVNEDGTRSSLETVRNQ